MVASTAHPSRLPQSLVLCAILTLSAAAQSTLPAKPLTPHPEAPMQTSAQQAEAHRLAHLPLVNGQPYDQPSTHDLFLNSLRDSYGLPALLRATASSLYSEGRDKPAGWGQDAAGYGQRLGSATAITAINGNMRLAMELVFHEDLRYLPCRRCSIKRKVENSLLAEITARHGEDGHRSFSLTPTIADYTGPIIAHQSWYPVGGGRGPEAGAVSARLVFATRIGAHLVDEFLIDPYKARHEKR